MLHVNVMNGVVSLVDVVGNRFVPLVFYVRKVPFEVGVKGASSFSNVGFGAFGAMIHVEDVVGLTVEQFGDVHQYLGYCTLVTVPMKGHVLQFTWLHGRVPEWLDVAVLIALACLGCLCLVCLLAQDLGHLGPCLEIC